jgi:hypothetical protein
MHKGPQRFEFFLLQLEKVMTTAAKQKNPALYLYQNDARTPLFMLEGLAKLYIEIHNKKKFTKLKEQFKILEDAIGAIDYYDAIAKNLKKNKKVSAKVIQYLQAQTREKIQHLNELLIENKWTVASNERITKIRKKLGEADWLKEEEEINELYDFYGKAIYDIIEFTQGTQYKFSNMESDVHELRRKLRWLSIYPQALQGCVQLSDSAKKLAHLKKYLTNPIVTSPFNKMPDAGNLNYFLLLDKDCFLSLSWMIAELGKLKDNGLQIVAMKEALLQTEGTTEAAALKQIYQALGTKQLKLNTLLNNAEVVCKTYFEEHNLEHLVVAATRIKKLNN